MCLREESICVYIIWKRFVVFNNRHIIIFWTRDWVKSEKPASWDFAFDSCALNGANDPDCSGRAGRTVYVCVYIEENRFSVKAKFVFRTRHACNGFLMHVQIVCICECGGSAQIWWRIDLWSIYIYAVALYI